LYYPTQMQTQVELKAIETVKDFITLSERLTRSHKDKLVDIYKEYSTFSEQNKNEVNKVLPRIIGRHPKWIVSGRARTRPEAKLDAERSKKKDKDQDPVAMVQDYLTYLFDEYNLFEPYRLWAKSMLIYGYSFSRTVFKSEIAMISSRGKDGTYGAVQEVIGEYPTIEVVNFPDIYIDPRYAMARDMPAIAEKVNSVRLSEMYDNKKYKNVQMLQDVMSAALDDEIGDFTKRVHALSGISLDTKEDFKDGLISITKYYGFFCKTEDQKDEKLYEIHVANNTVVVFMEEIIQKPFVDIKCFDDPEVYFATGFVEPIVELQKELNYKKNTGSTYINGALNRSWIWSPLSGINPSTLVNRPNNIIATNTNVQIAMQNLQELPHRTIDPAFFQEQNDFERQIQSATFTIDTSSNKGQQALTDTATGMRIKMFENNAVIEEVRRHFEKGVEEQAYKLLQATFDNVKGNIVFKKQGTEEYWEMNSDVLRNAIQKYSIKVEAGSSSFDNIEDRRSNAIALQNILTQAFQAGAVDEKGLAEGVRNVLETFEKVDPDKYMKQVTVEQFMPQQQEGMPQEGAPQGKMGKLPMPEGKPEGAKLVQGVAQGKILQ